MHEIHLYHMTTSTVVAIYLAVVNSTCDNRTIGSSPDSLLWESGARLTQNYVWITLGRGLKHWASNQKRAVLRYYTLEHRRIIQ